MQTEEQEQGAVPYATAVEPSMPKWFKILLQIYAVLTGLNVMLWASDFILDIGEDILSSFSTELNLHAFIFAGIYLLGIISLILLITFSIGLFRMRRWVLPVLIFYLVGLSLISTLALVFKNYTGVVGDILNLVFALVVGYGAWFYRATFFGPMRKLWLQIPLFVVLVSIFSFLVIAQVFTDDGEIRDADLLLPQVEVLSKEDNAYFFIPTVEALSPEEQSALDLALEYYRDLEQGNAVDSIEVSKVLESLSHIADMFIEISKVQGYQCPLTVNTIYSLESEYCDPSVFRSIAIVVALRSYVEVVQGNIDTALENAYASARLGKLLTSGQPDLIEYFVGLALVKIGIESIDRIEKHANATLSNETVQSIVYELEKHKFDGSALENAVKDEYATFKVLIQEPRQTVGYLWHYNSTINEFAEHTRKEIEIARTECGDTLSERKNAHEMNIKRNKDKPLWWTVIKPNAIGSVLTRVFVTSTAGPSRERVCEVNELNEAVQQRLEATIAIESKNEV